MIKYKIEFFSVRDNAIQKKLIDNYSDFAVLYYQLLQSKWIKDLHAFAWSKTFKRYKEVVNV